MPFFPNETLEIYSHNSQDYDYFGEKQEYKFRETVKVNLDPLSPDSSLKEFGKILQDTYTIFLDSDVEINDTDLLIINNIKYEIIGSVKEYNHSVLPHKEIIVKRQRKKED